MVYEDKNIFQLQDLFGGLTNYRILCGEYQLPNYLGYWTRVDLVDFVSHSTELPSEDALMPTQTSLANGHNKLLLHLITEGFGHYLLRTLFEKNPTNPSYRGLYITLWPIEFPIRHRNDEKKNPVPICFSIQYLCFKFNMAWNESHQWRVFDWSRELRHDWSCSWGEHDGLCHHRAKHRWCTFSTKGQDFHRGRKFPRSQVCLRQS